MKLGCQKTPKQERLEARRRRARDQTSEIRARLMRVNLSKNKRLGCLEARRFSLSVKMTI